MQVLQLILKYGELAGGIWLLDRQERKHPVVVRIMVFVLFLSNKEERCLEYTCSIAKKIPNLPPRAGPAAETLGLCFCFFPYSAPFGRTRSRSVRSARLGSARLPEAAAGKAAPPHVKLAQLGVLPLPRPAGGPALARTRTAPRGGQELIRQ